MKISKTIWMVLLAIMLCFYLTACDSSDNGNNDKLPTDNTSTKKLVGIYSDVEGNTIFTYNNDRISKIDKISYHNGERYVYTENYKWEGNTITETSDEDIKIYTLKNGLIKSFTYTGTGIYCSNIDYDSDKHVISVDYHDNYGTSINSYTEHLTWQNGILLSSDKASFVTNGNCKAGYFPYN